MKHIVASGGVTVMLGPNIQGFIPDIHLADIPLKHPENFYETGKAVRCKVMSSSLPPIHYKILEKIHSWNTWCPCVGLFRFQLSLFLHIINVVEQILWYTCNDSRNPFPPIVFMTEFKKYMVTKSTDQNVSSKLIRPLVQSYHKIEFNV